MKKGRKAMAKSKVSCAHRIDVVDLFENLTFRLVGPKPGLHADILRQGDSEQAQCQQRRMLATVANNTKVPLSTGCSDSWQ